MEASKAKSNSSSIRSCPSDGKGICYAFMFITPTFSVVTAAKTVLEYGAQATSPTGAPRLNWNNGSAHSWSQILTLQS